MITCKLFIPALARAFILCLIRTCVIHHSLWQSQNESPLPNANHAFFCNVGLYKIVVQILKSVSTLTVYNQHCQSEKKNHHDSYLYNKPKHDNTHIFDTLEKRNKQTIKKIII